MSLEYEILQIVPGDEPEVVSFLNTHFAPDEPLNATLDTQSQCSELFRTPLWLMDSSLNLKMVSKSGDLLGIALNQSLSEPENEKDDLENEKNEDKPLDESDPMFILRPIHTFLNRLEEQLPLKHKNNAMAIHIIVVDKQYRQIGVGRKLIDASVEMAREKQFSGILVTCTSHYSALLFGKVEGFKPILKVPYKEYLDDTGKPVFSPLEPHDSANVFYMDLLMG